MIATLPYEKTDVSDTPDQDGDELLRLGASRRLCSTGYRPLRSLRCAVAAGVVTISGSVPSFFLKQMAQEAVLRLDQVREVRNLVEVWAAEYGQRFQFEEESRS